MFGIFKAMRENAREKAEKKKEERKANQAKYMARLDAEIDQAEQTMFKQYCELIKGNCKKECNFFRKGGVKSTWHAGGHTCMPYQTEEKVYSKCGICP